MSTFTEIKFGPFNTLSNEYGYINVTKICKMYDKKLNHWLALSSVKSTIKTLADNLNVEPSNLIMIKGKNANNNRGTYVHPNLAINIIRWCSYDYEIIFNEILLNELSKDSARTPVIISGNDNIKIDQGSGIYLIKLGYVKNNRIDFMIPSIYTDNQTMYKFGRSYDINSRFLKHKQNYSCSENIELIYSSYVCPKFLSKAENDLKTYFLQLKIKLDNEKYYEIIIFPDELLSMIKTIYDGVSSKYLNR